MVASFKNGEMHTIALVGAAALTGALFGTTFYMSESKGDHTPPLEEMQVIEAQLAYKKTTAKPKQPQKQFREPDPVVKPDGVSRDENKKPDEKKPKDEKKPSKDTSEVPKIFPDRTGSVDDPVGKPDPIGAFDGDQYGVGDVTKGDPYFARLSRDLAWQPPELARGSSEPIGCVQIAADGKIPQTKFKETSSDDLGSLAESALRALQQKRNQNPEQVPTHLLKALTTQWICFKFTVKAPE